MASMKTAEVLNPLRQSIISRRSANFPTPGFEVLKWLRLDASIKSPVVLVLTTSKEPSDVEKAFDLGANAYLAKPSSVSQLYEMMKAVKQFWLAFNQFA